MADPHDESGLNSIRKLIHRSCHFMWYFVALSHDEETFVIRCPASVILLGEGGKEKAYKYYVNINIMDPQKTRRSFETWHLLLL